MCKIMCVAGIKPKKTRDLWRFLLASVKPMTANDKDGLGYAAVSKTTELFAERWLRPNEAFRLREAYTDADAALLKELGSAVEGRNKYSSEGAVSSKDTQAVILHSRMATCGVAIENTHPFLRQGTALIHNGVISNHYILTKHTSTCDSEVILNEYIEAGADREPKEIQTVADALDGYYACGVLTKDASGRWVMDIFKDARAELYVAHVKELNARVFCTSASILADTCKRIKFTLGSVFKVKAGNLIRIDVATGDVVSVSNFDTNSFRQPAISTGSVLTFGSTSRTADETQQIEEYIKRMDGGMND